MHCVLVWVTFMNYSLKMHLAAKLFGITLTHRGKARATDSNGWCALSFSRRLPCPLVKSGRTVAICEQVKGENVQVLAVKHHMERKGFPYSNTRNFD